MGGRGTAGKTKLFTNIDAARNVPLREARAKEIEAERAAKEALRANSKQKASVKKRVIEKKGTVSVLLRSGKKEFGSYGLDVLERRDIPSIARAGDLHLTKGQKSWQFIVTDSVTGYAVRNYQNRKDAISFMNGVTRSDGSTSPTLRRMLNRMVNDEKSTSTMRSAKAYSRYVEMRRRRGQE